MSILGSSFHMAILNVISQTEKYKAQSDYDWFIEGEDTFEGG